MKLIRYNSARLFAKSRTAPNTIDAISLVTNVEFGFNIERTEIQSVGYRYIQDNIDKSPRPFLKFSYYLSDVDNEKLFRMPVTSEEAVQDQKCMFTGIESFDLFFATVPDSLDFINSNEDVIEICAFSNAILENYGMSVTQGGVIKIDVVFSAEDLIFKTFKNLDKYNLIDYDVEDLKVTNENNLLINPSDDSEISLGFGGFTMRNVVTEFNFAASLNYKTLYDFGQRHHSRRIQFPINGTVNLDAIVSEHIHGQISNLLCDDRYTDFAVTNSRVDCEDGTRGPNSQKSGLLLKGAKLINQTYGLSSAKGGFLTTAMSFDVEITRNYGAWMTQHIAQVDDVFESEDPDILLLLLEDPSGEIGILAEAALNMLDTLKKFSNIATKN
jgi:hypothetical protein